MCVSFPPQGPSPLAVSPLLSPTHSHPTVLGHCTGTRNRTCGSDWSITPRQGMLENDGKRERFPVREKGKSIPMRQEMPRTILVLTSMDACQKISTHRIAYLSRVVRPQPIHRPHVPTCTENTRIRQLTLQKRHVGAHDACRRWYVTLRDATSKTNALGTSTSTLRTKWKPSRGERLYGCSSQRPLFLFKARMPIYNTDTPGAFFLSWRRGTEAQLFHYHNNRSN